jgi:hypothetical protein
VKTPSAENSAVDNERRSGIPERLFYSSLSESVVLNAERESEIIPTSGCFWNESAGMAAIRVFINNIILIVYKIFIVFYGCIESFFREGWRLFGSVLKDSGGKRAAEPMQIAENASKGWKRH